MNVEQVLKSLQIKTPSNKGNGLLLSLVTITV